MRINGPFNLLNIEAALMIWLTRHSLSEVTEWIISIMRPVCEPFSQGVDFRETTLTSKLQNGREKLSRWLNGLKRNYVESMGVSGFGALPPSPPPVPNPCETFRNC